MKVDWMDVSEYSKADFQLLYTHHSRMASFFLDKLLAADKPKRGPKKGVKRGPRKAKRASKAAAE